MAAQFPIAAILRLLLPGFARQSKKAGKQLERGLNVGKLAGRMRKLLGGALALGGIGGFATVVNDVRQFEKLLEATAVQAGFTATQTAQLRLQIFELSSATGVSRVQIAQAAQEVINLEGASGFSAEKLGLLTRASIASGAPMRSLAGLMFTINKNMFKGAGTAAQLESALSAVLQAGKEGAVPLNEMDQVLQQVTAGFSRVGKEGVEGVAQLAAALQAVRGDFGTAGEAGTGLRNLLTSLARNATKIRKLSGGKLRILGKEKDPVTGKTVKRVRDIRDIITDLGNSKLARNDTLLIKALGSKEAAAFATALINNIDKWDELTAVASNSSAVQEDSAAKSQSSNGKIRKSINDLKLALEEAFTPERIELFASTAGAALKGLTATIDGLLKSMEALGIGTAILIDAIDPNAIKQKFKAAQSETALAQGRVIAQEGIDKPLINALEAQARGEISQGQRQRVEAEILSEGGLVTEEEVQRRASERTFERAQGAGLITPTGDVDVERVERAAAITRGEVVTGGDSVGRDLERQKARVESGGRSIETGAAQGLQRVVDSMVRATAKQEAAADRMSEAARKLGINVVPRGTRP